MPTLEGRTCSDALRHININKYGIFCTAPNTGQNHDRDDIKAHLFLLYIRLIMDVL